MLCYWAAGDFWRKWKTGNRYTAGLESTSLSSPKDFSGPRLSPCLAAFRRCLRLCVRVVRFKSGDVTVLVATDLAARGLDITVSLSFATDRHIESYSAVFSKYHLPPARFSGIKPLNGGMSLNGQTVLRTLSSCCVNRTACWELGRSGFRRERTPHPLGHSDNDNDVTRQLRRDVALPPCLAMSPPTHTTLMVPSLLFVVSRSDQGVHTVINFEMPRSADSYIHRVGRTARAGCGGRSVTLIGEA